ncbi:MAG: putative iron-sulfur cluster insertion protein ErpA [marine bacterium B5-7]|nr:MAG: putative iron-sulfur cluster insertion protein ErpA [marine bacterium B5-7]
MTTTSVSTLKLSDTATQQVAALKLQKNNPDLLLRVFVQGGGCSGFQYGFQFENERDEEDLLIENEGVNVVVDPLSYQYLMGAEIDFMNDLQGSRFVVRNPNASTTCGCGSSFSI